MAAPAKASTAEVMTKAPAAADVTLSHTERASASKRSADCTLLGTYGQSHST